MDRRTFLGAVSAVAAGSLGGCAKLTEPSPTPTAALSEFERVSGPYADAARWVPAYRKRPAALRGFRTEDVERYRAVSDRFPETYRRPWTVPDGPDLADLITPPDVDWYGTLYEQRYGPNLHVQAYETDRDPEAMARVLMGADYRLAAESDAYRGYVPEPEHRLPGQHPMVVGDGYLAEVPWGDDHDVTPFLREVGETRAGAVPSHFATYEPLRALAERLSPGLHSSVETAPLSVWSPEMDELPDGLVRGTTTSVDGETVTLTEYDLFRSAEAASAAPLERYVEIDDRLSPFDDVEFELDGRTARMRPVDRSQTSTTVRCYSRPAPGTDVPAV